MEEAIDIDSKVFVINWGQQYDLVATKSWFNVAVPQYSGTEFFYKIVRQELTAAGKPYKRSIDRPVKERIPVWKNFKYTVLEIVSHPNGEDGLVCLIASEEGCYAVIGIKGLSYLTPEQYADKEFDALKEYHKNKWSIDMRKEAQKSFPEKLKAIVYDKDDNVLFGSRVVKGKVQYQYIPAEYMTTQRPFIICVSVLYDGKGNSDLPENSLLMHYVDLPKMFPDNQFR